MKKWLSVSAAMVVCLALVIGIACGGGEGREEGVKKLKWGMGLPMTGFYGAITGLPTKYAMEMMEELIGEFTVGGQPYRWEIICEDNGLSVAGGAASARVLIYEHHVDFMTQAGRDSSFATVEITEPLGMILDMGAASPWDLRPDWPHTIITAGDWTQGASTFFDWLTKEHPEVKRVASTCLETFVGEALHDAFKRAAEYYGLEFKSEEIPLGTVEYYPIATKLMAYNPDLVQGTLPLFEAMWEMGYEGLCIAYHWTEAAAGTVSWDKAAGNVLIYMVHPFTDLFPEVPAIREEYEHRYGVEMTASTLWAIEEVYILTEVLKQADTVDDVDKIIGTIESGVSFDTPLGSIHFGGEALNGIGHLAIWPSPIYKVVGPGEYEVVAYYTPEEVEAIQNAVYAGID